MENEKYRALHDSLVSIASESFRFQRVFERAVAKLGPEEGGKYLSQYSWFSKRVSKALEVAGLKILNLEGQLYDPGMAVTPLNIEDFDIDDVLFISQMIEPIIMDTNTIIKTGTVILGRAEK